VRKKPLVQRTCVHESPQSPCDDGDDDDNDDDAAAVQGEMAKPMAKPMAKHRDHLGPAAAGRDQEKEKSSSQHHPNQDDGNKSA
jgi:hypothetical protein